jgi:glucose-1-phosphatase
VLFIFDMGGVVSANVQTIPAMAAKLGISVESFLSYCGVPKETDKASIYEFGILEEIQSGRIDSAAFWDSFRSSAKKDLSESDPTLQRIDGITRDENLWAACFNPKPMDDTIEIINSLKRAGNRVVCGTNTLDAHYKIHKEARHYEIFDAVYASHLMGVIKPDPGFWEAILSQEKVKAEESIFIDDNDANVRASIATGLKGILFTNAQRLATELADYF